MNLTDNLFVKTKPVCLFYRAEIELHYHNTPETCVHHPFDLVCHVGTKRISQKFEIEKDMCMNTKPDDKSPEGTLINDFVKYVLQLIII